MISKVELCNRALRLVCCKEINSMEQGCVEARACKSVFDAVFRSTLSKGNWSFAMAYETLAQNVDNPPFGYAYSFEMPVSCVRVVDIRSSKNLREKGEKYSIVGRSIYTDAQPCYIRYIQNVTDVTYLPSYFCDAFVKKLASEIAPLLSEDSSLGLKIAELFEQEVRMALLLDAVNQNEEETDSHLYNSFMNAR